MCKYGLTSVCYVSPSQPARYFNLTRPWLRRTSGARRADLSDGVTAMGDGVASDGPLLKSVTSVYDEAAGEKHPQHGREAPSRVPRSVFVFIVVAALGNALFGASHDASST